MSPTLVWSSSNMFRSSYWRGGPVSLRDLPTVAHVSTWIGSVLHTYADPANNSHDGRRGNCYGGGIVSRTNELSLVKNCECTIHRRSAMVPPAIDDLQ